MSIELNPDQDLAARTLDRSVLVTAGAGSGKTRMLVQRFVNALLPERAENWEPVGPDEVVAITYTEKAAGELAERIRATLRAAGKIDEARRVDTAWVSTIHGLCSRILRRNAFEAGVDPQFAVADTVLSGNLQERAFDEAVANLAERDADVPALLDTYGYQPVFGSVSALARELAVRRRAVEDTRFEASVAIDALIEESEAALRRGCTACDEYDGSAKTPHDFVDACGVLLERVSALSDSSIDDGERMAELAAILACYKPLGRRVDPLVEFSEENAELVQRVRERLGATIAEPHIRAICRLAEAYATRFAALKRQAGILDFDDLQVLAQRLLSNDAALATRYRDAFRLVMIDEFQDTDALQLALLESLSRDDLCTVGDEKQSIYRFRGADIDVYRAHQKRMRESGALYVRLAVNYRSHPDILTFVNALFSCESYFNGKLLRLQQPPDGHPAQSVDDALGDGPRVEAHFVDFTDSDARIGRQAEAALIADRVFELQQAGVDPGDIAVLVRRYTHAHVYADAFSAVGIPAVIVGGSRFFRLPEIATMRALVRCIANSRDGAALGKLLASDFCPVPDLSLARERLVREGRDPRSLWEVLVSIAEKNPGADGEAARVLVGVLTRASERLGAQPLDMVLLRAVEEAGYDLRLLGGGNLGRDAFANVLKFVRQAGVFELESTGGAAGFAQYLDDKELVGDRESPVAVADEGMRAVQIMSVHASKGLEFPVVIVPDLAGGSGGREIPLRIAADGELVRLALKPPTSDEDEKLPDSSWYTELSEAEKIANEEEDNRVLYVAFTRARDLLLLGGSMRLRPKGGKTTSKCDLVRLARVLGVEIPLPEAGESVATLDDEGASVNCRVRIVDAFETERVEAGDPDENTRESEPPEPGGLTPLAEVPLASTAPDTISYSQIDRFKRCPRRFFAESILRLACVDIASPEDVGPTRFGSALHAALQLVDRAGNPPSASRLEAIGAQFELGPQALERLGRAVQRFCTSATAQQAVCHERLAREVAFSLPLAEGVFRLAGSMDLYARSGTDALVVDYKSGQSGDSADLRERYGLQARCYALAALTDGSTRARVVFVRLETSSQSGAPEEVSFEFTAEDLSGLRNEIEALHASICKSAFEPLAKRDHDTCRDCPAPRGLCVNASR